jgi:hypothetical protein
MPRLSKVIAGGPLHEFSMKDHAIEVSSERISGGTRLPEFHFSRIR